MIYLFQEAETFMFFCRISEDIIHSYRTATKHLSLRNQCHGQPQHTVLTVFGTDPTEPLLCDFQMFDLADPGGRAV